jgi:hypothetical protein
MIETLLAEADAVLTTTVKRILKARTATLEILVSHEAQRFRVSGLTFLLRQYVHAIAAL